MKKKLIFSGMVLLALVLTSGTFAYTYNTSGTTLQATVADAVWTTYQPSEEQPDWESILPEGEYNAEYLLPHGAGDYTELTTQYPIEGEHWDKVGELYPDDLNTYVSTLNSLQWETDLYNLSNFLGVGGYETITNVTVYFRVAATSNDAVSVRAALKANGSVHESPTLSVSGTTFVTNSYSLTANPNTGEDWTWQDINGLQAGVTMRGRSMDEPAICTQVYVQVDYEFVIIEGLVPQGDLFDITPHVDYTGDLLVKIYLMNTADLLKAYQYVNIKAYMANSLEAEKTPNYQILSLETGVALFNIEGGSSENYTIEITGGAYRLVSDDPLEWGEGWSITPEFYCEIGQR